ncbi:hypothetical protein [Nocardia callitridis]|uniref:hypothetical protein n=1 Tax=Nocardia callitridis TaxID=648753 RepID=UPI0031EBE6C5
MQDSSIEVTPRSVHAASNWATALLTGFAFLTTGFALVTQQSPEGLGILRCRDHDCRARS